MVDAPAMYRSSHGQSSDKSEPYYGASKLNIKDRGFPENNAFKSFVPDKEKASNVAKIKVVVCSPLLCRLFLLNNFGRALSIV